MTRVGESLGSIRIVGLLGAGGMGDVYEGYDETLRRRVALKTIRADRRLSAQARARFLREARILSRLDHPNICRIHDFISRQETDSLVLEFIQGRTLDQVIATKPGFDLRLEIALAIAGVLVAAHAEDIVHRDLKPNNVMLTPDGQVKVLDFGLARAGEHETPPPAEHGAEEAEDAEEAERDGSVEPGPPSSRGDSQAPTLGSSQAPTVESNDRTTTLASVGGLGLLTQHGSVMGTPLFMSPEQARGELIHTSSDMYSFGLLLQTLFTGELPYPRGIRTDELLARASRGETLEATGIGSDLKALIDRLESLAPAARPTAVEALERLEWIREKPRRRLRRLALAVAVVAVVLAGLKYTLDLRRERTIAVAAQRVAEQRRGQAEDLIGFMLGDLRKKLEPLGQLEILDDVGSNAMTYFAAVTEEELSDEELSKRSRALYQIGEVRIARGQLDSAIEPLEESLALARRLVERAPDDGDRLFEAGQSHFWVGFVHWRRGDLDAAVGQFRDYLLLSEQLVEMDPENPGWRLELAYANSNIGSVLQAQGAFKEALERFGTALGIKKELLAADPDNTDWRIDVARSHDTVGYIREALGDYAGALDHYRSELAIKDALALEQPSHAQWQYELAINRNAIGALLAAMGDLEGGLGYFQASTETLTGLIRRDATNSRWKRELSVTLANTGEAQRKSGRIGSARESFESSIEILEELIARDPTDAGWQSDLAVSRQRLGMVLAAGGDLEGARDAGLAAEGILALLLAARPDDRQARSTLSDVHNLLGEVWAARGERGLADAAWLRAVEVIEALATESSDRRILEPWIRALLCLDRREQARPFYEKLNSFGYSSEELQQRWDAAAERVDSVRGGASR